MSYKLSKKIVAIVSAVSLLPLISFAATVQMTTVGGSLTSTPSSSTVTLTGSLNVSTSNTTNTGSLTGNDITDTRGTLVGWTVSATMTNLASTSIAYDVGVGTSTANGTVAFSGTSNCLYASTTQAAAWYNLTTTNASGGYNITRPDGSTLTGASAATVALGDGLTLTTTAGGSTNAVVNKPIGCALYTNDTITPTALTSVSGSTLGLTLGSAGAFAGSGATSNTKTILQAPAGTGNGDFNYNINFSQLMKPNGLAGLHTGTITITVA